MRQIDRELLHAAEKRDVLTVRECLRQGADMYAEEEYGGYSRVPWQYAVMDKETTELMGEFIKAGFDANTRVEGNAQMPVLRLAAIYGHANTVRLLVENGADKESKNLALHEAAYRGYPDVVTILLNNNADVNAKDQYGDTPLESARKAMKTHGDSDGLLANTIGVLVRFIGK